MKEDIDKSAANYYRTLKLILKAKLSTNPTTLLKYKEQIISEFNDSVQGYII